MKVSTNTHSRPKLKYFLIIGVVSLLIFALDLHLPLGIADGVLYISLVLIALIAGDRRLIVIAAVLGSVLTVSGFFFSPPGGEFWKVVVNRALSIMAIWMTAILSLLQNRSEENLQKAHDKLDERVRGRTAELNETNDRLRRESEFVQLHKDIAVNANQTQALPDTVRTCLKRICHFANWPVGHLYLAEYRPDGPRMVPTPFWYLEDRDQYENFKRISETTPLDYGEGLPGRVMASGKPAWIIDVTEDPNFPRAKLAENIGVKAGFAFPILIGQEVVGVMEFFSTHAAEPDQQMLDIMAQIGTQLGRVMERNRAAKDIQRSREQLRQLYHRLELVREEERTRIAREVHDELAQVLTTLKLELSLLDKKLPAGSADLRKDSRMMIDLIDNTIQVVKKIAMDLRPSLLDDLGLPEAIEWQGREFERRTGIQCEFDLPHDMDDLDKDRATTVFRIFQEALTNVVRHAQATKINIALKSSDGMLRLQVNDNGVGITSSQVSDLHSLGILGMRERADVWGGTVDIKGIAGQGTSVTIKIQNPNNRNVKHENRV